MIARMAAKPLVHARPVDDDTAGVLCGGTGASEDITLCVPRFAWGTYGINPWEITCPVCRERLMLVKQGGHATAFWPDGV